MKDLKDIIELLAWCSGIAEYIVYVPSKPTASDLPYMLISLVFVCIGFAMTWQREFGGEEGQDQMND